MRHGTFKTRNERRTRYRCILCGKTFSSNTGTAYAGIQYTKARFDLVAHLSVDGVSKSAISRVLNLPWNTVARWLERAAAAAKLFNEERTQGFDQIEFQADVIIARPQCVSPPLWVFATIEV